MIEIVGMLIMTVLKTIFDLLFGERCERKHEERLRRAGKLTCHLRMVEGRHPNLSPIWSLVEVRLAPGRISTRRLDVPTAGLDLSTVRAAAGRELWELAEGSTVVLIRTPDGVVQWALPADKAEWALERVAPVEPSTSAPASRVGAP